MGDDMTIKRLIALIISSISITACSQNLESSTFNVYVYPSANGPEISLGQAKGLSQCQSLAWAYKNKNNLSNSWGGYICCLQTSTSSCASKHK